MQAETLPEIPEHGAGESAARDWLRELDALAKAGNDRAAEALRRSRTERPDLWRHAGTIAEQAEASWLLAFAPDATKDAMLRTALRHDAERLRADLLDDASDPAERLLVSRIVVCHLAAAHADGLHAQAVAAGETLAVCDWHAGQAERAHRRFLKAVESLAKVRRLRGPAVQVNVAMPGGKQVNVAAVDTAAERPALAAGAEDAPIEAMFRPAHAVGEPARRYSHETFPSSGPRRRKTAQ